MLVRRKAKMEKLALIALIMVLGLSGCACPGTSGPIKQDWATYLKGIEGDWESTKQDWTAYWKNPGGENWERIEKDWAAYWKNPGGETWELMKQDWSVLELTKAWCKIPF
jgi:hypothetical protein